ncbi:MAG: gamma carbonic anhydrase family protein [Planctomycetota bacterium]
MTDDNTQANDAARRPPCLTQHTRRELVDATAWIAPNATVIGESVLEARSSVWFHATLRGDTERIVLGSESNVQEQCVLHCDPGFPTIIGQRVTIGHGAIVHGAVVEDDALIGIGAIILNGARIGKGAIVAAGALVTEGTEIPDGMLAMGTPAKPIKPVGDALRERTREGNAHYVELAQRYLALYASGDSTPPN